MSANNELGKSSMKRRCDDFDYRGRAIYMVTMVVAGWRPLLGSVVGNCDAVPGSDQFPRVNLSALGEAVSDCWQAIARFHPMIELIAFQVMPDHVHGILFVHERMEKPLGKVILGFKQGCNKRYREIMASHDGAVIQHGTAPDGGYLFEHGYNDRILWHAHQLEAWKQYLAQNPYRLLLRRANVNYFRVVLVAAAGRVFTAQGNQSLLSSGVIRAVKCSRNVSADAVSRLVAEALRAAGSGVVHVSPFISSGEKVVKDALVDAGFPIIHLVENGLTRYSKPAGKMHDYCARGLLLVMSPWEHHTNKVGLNRNHCLQLNDVAAQIADGDG